MYKVRTLTNVIQYVVITKTQYLKYYTRNSDHIRTFITPLPSTQNSALKKYSKVFYFMLVNYT